MTLSQDSSCLLAFSSPWPTFPQAAGAPLAIPYPSLAGKLMEHQFIDLVFSLIRNVSVSDPRLSPFQAPLAQGCSTASCSSRLRGLRSTVLNGIELFGAMANFRDLDHDHRALAGPLVGVAAGAVGAVHRYFLGGFTAVPCAMARFWRSRRGIVYVASRAGRSVWEATQLMAAMSWPHGDHAAIAGFGEKVVPWCPRSSCPCGGQGAGSRPSSHDQQPQPGARSRRSATGSKGSSTWPGRSR
jgi:hypothetical protein